MIVNEKDFWDYVATHKTIILQRYRCFDYLTEEYIPKHKHDVIEYKGEFYQVCEDPIYTLEGIGYKYKAKAQKISDGSMYTVKWLAGSVGTADLPSTIFDYPMYRVHWDRPIRMEPISQ